MATMGNVAVPLTERTSICLPRPGTKDILQHGDADFPHALQQFYASAESNALEALITMKTKLRNTTTADFWTECTEGLAGILNAEMTFIMKRMLVDEHGAPVEMPPIGEPGSCLVSAAMHYCIKDGPKGTLKGHKFWAYGCPCAYMRHDKVFLLPEALNDFITDNPNTLMIQPEAYIAVPIFAEGKCVAHFGIMWSKQTAAQRTLSWGFIEMLLHTLEDMITQRLLEGTPFDVKQPASNQRSVIPHDAVTVAQSLRPYAGSLSHELRTPMQGVVGMLDVMYATVLEAADTNKDQHLSEVFQHLKENIEVVQDSSRRAVEAADNVVHAYDMGMTVPDGPPGLPMDESEEMTSPLSTPATFMERRPDILVAGSNLPMSRPNNKRRRDDMRQGNYADQGKTPRLDGAASPVQSRKSQPSQDLMDGVHEAAEVQTRAQLGADTGKSAIAEEVQPESHAPRGPHRVIAPGLRHTNIRELIQNVINEGLKVGGRPDSATAHETELGEIIEVRTRGSDGTLSRKLIDWSVEPCLPESLLIDEKDLSKLVSCVFLNAIKFTDRVDGRVFVQARASSRGRYISIRIQDNGPGIPAAFLPRLFKPFSQINGSLTRQSEGLGLGLMVGRGIARKLGGDLMCTRAETEGSEHSTEFEIKIPIIAGEIISRPSSPFGSPVPRRANLTRTELPDGPPPLPPAPQSPRKVARVLEAALGEVSVRSALGLAGTPPPQSPEAGYTSLPRGPSIPIPPPPASSSSPARPRLQRRTSTVTSRPRSGTSKPVSNPEVDRDLASKFPLTFLVAEDNKINRKLLVTMLSKLGYRRVFEAHDGAEAVRQMSVQKEHIDVILMDLWMPLMDGYEATERILKMKKDGMRTGTDGAEPPTVLAVTADVTEGALERAAQVGMKGFMTKPFKILDLQRLITAYCAQRVVPATDMCGVEPVMVQAQAQVA